MCRVKPSQPVTGENVAVTAYCRPLRTLFQDGSQLSVSCRKKRLDPRHYLDALSMSTVDEHLQAIVLAFPMRPHFAWIVHVTVVVQNFDKDHVGIDVFGNSDHHVHFKGGLRHVMGRKGEDARFDGSAEAVKYFLGRGINC